MKKYIIADYVPDDSKDYLTEGKMYLVVNELVGGRNVEIYADNGALIICRVAGSAHLGGKAFRVVEVDDTPKKPTGGIRDVETPDTIDTTKAELIYKLDGVFFTKTTIDGERSRSALSGTRIGWTLLFGQIGDYETTQVQEMQAIPRASFDTGRRVAMVSALFSCLSLQAEQLATLQAELTHAESRIICLKKLLATHAKLFPTKE